MIFVKCSRMIVYHILLLETEIGDIISVRRFETCFCWPADELWCFFKYRFLYHKNIQEMYSK